MKKRNPLKQEKLERITTKRALYEKARKEKNRIKKGKRIENSTSPPASL